MKKVLSIAILSSLFVAPAFAGEMPAGFTLPKTSAALEQIKSLAGKWQGVASEAGEAPPNAEYRVTSGGSAVEERLFVGTPQEMVSMYHDVNGKLSMTHYCMLGNQPQLEDKGSDATKIVLRESEASKAILAGQMRMGALTIEWKDKDTIVQTWGEDVQGQKDKPTVITLKRAA